MAANSTKSAQRGPGRPFVKGQSGNPKGRPKQTQEQKDAHAMIRKLAPQAVERLREILEDPRVKTSDLLRAIEIVFDRAFGKEDYVGRDNALLLSLVELERRGESHDL